MPCGKWYTIVEPPNDGKFITDTLPRYIRRFMYTHYLIIVLCIVFIYYMTYYSIQLVYLTLLLLQ